MNDLQRHYRGNEAALAWRAQTGVTRSEGRAASFETEKRGIAAWITREATAAWAACGAFERVALAYLAASSALIGVFAENLAHPAKLFGVQASVAAMILVLCLVEARAAEQAKWRGKTAASKFWHFWRHWYPHLFFLFCFEELGKLAHLATPARNDFMQFAYLTYFTYLLMLGGILYYRRDWRGYWSVMTYSAAGYAIGYVIAIFFPIESPWFSMAGVWHGSLQGGPFTATINFIEHFGRVRGAAFPSEHVAGSVAALWGAWRHQRCLFWVMVPMVMCMCVSTVWGRYHYVMDVFGGMVTGTLGFAIGSWIMKTRGAVATAAP